MTTSHRLARLQAGAPLSAPAPAARFSSTLVGWLIQTAFLSVVEETCETFSESRGFYSRRGRHTPSRLIFPLNLYQHALISRMRGRESKLSSVGHVAGVRRRRRAVRG
jgi:hypothetical protein